jgi:hypothetical protein
LEEPESTTFQFILKVSIGSSKNIEIPVVKDSVTKSLKSKLDEFTSTNFHLEETISDKDAHLNHALDELNKNKQAKIMKFLRKIDKFLHRSNIND